MQAVVCALVDSSKFCPAHSTCFSRAFSLDVQVGDSKLHYTFTQSSPYYFDLVVANGAVPVASVEISIGGQWILLTRANNNVYPYYNSNGFYTFPLDVRITPVCGPAVSSAMAAVQALVARANCAVCWATT